MNMTDRFNPANDNDPKKKLAYGLIALACVIALGLGLDAASCSRAGGAGDKGREQDVAEAVDGGSAAGDDEKAEEAGDGKEVPASPDPSETSGVRFEGFDKLSGMTATKRASLCDAVASTMRANGYDLDEITVSIKKKPQATDNGTVVFMRVKAWKQPRMNERP